MAGESGWRDRMGAAAARASKTASEVGGAAKHYAGNAGAQAAGRTGSGVAGVLSAVPPPVPGMPWRIGLAQFLAAQPGVPVGAARFLGVLDRFGAVRLSPDELGFDGDTVRWTQVQQMALAPVRDLLTDQAIEHEVDRLMAVLPRFPGRKWAVGQVADTVIGIATAAAGLDQRGGDAFDRRVPSSVTVKGRLRTTTMSPGLFATLVMAARPDVGEAITAAARRTVAVTAAPSSRALERAAGMTALAASLRDRFRQAQRDAAEDPGPAQ